MTVQAKAAVDHDDLVGFSELRRQLIADLPCLREQLPVDAWARFLLDDAVVEYALGEAWAEPLATALEIDPSLPRGDLPAALRDWSPPSTSQPESTLAAGIYYLDGQPISRARGLSGVHVVQRDVAGVWTTRYLRNEPFPSDWIVGGSQPIGESSSSPRSNAAWIWTGGAMAFTGSVVGIASWASRGSVHHAEAGQKLVAVNVIGWSVAGAGCVVGGLGLALPLTAEDPLGMVVHGRF